MPDGDGTLQKPYCLDSAREQAARLVRNHCDDDIQVLLRGGTYRLNKTLVFRAGNSFAVDGHTITWKAYPGETPVLTSAVSLDGWERVQQTIPGLPAAAEGKLWSTPLPLRNGAPFVPKTLYEGYRRIPRARARGFRPTVATDPVITESIDLIKSDRRFDTIHFPPGAMRRYENVVDAELLIRPAYVWAMNILPLAEVDEAGCTARTAIDATYPMFQLRSAEAHRVRENSAWVENVFDGMTEPGRWVADSTRGRIYYWPREKSNDAPPTLLVPTLTELVRIAGSDSNPVRNLTLDGITFAHAERYTWDAGAIGLQHDWDLYDAPNALVRLRGAENCVVRNCRFTASGGGAIRLDLHCQRNHIEDNWIKGIGGTGILLAGYGPGNKDVNRDNFVEGNDISLCGQLYWSSPGIFLWQSGHNRIANNLVYDLPYDGIVISGPRPDYLMKQHNRREQFRANRWEEIDTEAAKLLANIKKDAANKGDVLEERTINFRLHLGLEKFLHARDNIIEANELHHVIQLLSDGDAIYLSGTGDNNIVRGNYIHDVISPGTGGHLVRADGSQYFTRFESNLIYRCSGTILTRSLCDAENNFIIDLVLPQDSDHPERRHKTINFFSGVQQTHRKRINRHNLYYQSDFIDNFAHIMDDFSGETANWEDVESDENLYFSPLESGIRVDGVVLSLATRLEAHQQRTGLDQHSVIADPLFVDLANRDFRFHPESPALKLGIKEINLHTVGLRGRRYYHARYHDHV
jgi:hypothetical protein